MMSSFLTLVVFFCSVLLLLYSTRMTKLRKKIRLKGKNEDTSKTEGSSLKNLKKKVGCCHPPHRLCVEFCTSAADFLCFSVILFCSCQHVNDKCMLQFQLSVYGFFELRRRRTDRLETYTVQAATCAVAGLRPARRLLMLRRILNEKRFLSKP